MTNFVVDQMGEAYPELEASREFIEKMVKLEEERFGSTMTVGLQKLDELLSKNDFAPDPNLPSPGYIPINELAKLYDTFGTPIDLMYVVLNSTYPKTSGMSGGNDYWTLERKVGTAPYQEEEHYSVVTPDRSPLMTKLTSKSSTRIGLESSSKFNSKNFRAKPESNKRSKKRRLELAM